MKIQAINNTNSTQIGKKNNKNINFGWVDITPDPNFALKNTKFKELKESLSVIISIFKEKFSKIYKRIF